MRAYLAGSYMAMSKDSETGVMVPDNQAIDKNIRRAEEVAIALSELGIEFFCPHTHTAHFQYKSKATEEFYLTMGLNHLYDCQAIIMIPGWEMSKGSQIERNTALSWELPVFLWPFDKNLIIEWWKENEVQES